MSAGLLLYQVAAGLDAPGEHVCPPAKGIRVVAGDDVNASTHRRRLFDEWNSGGHTRAELIEVGQYTDEERKEMAASAQAGRCSYDVLILDVAWTQEFARNGYIDEIPLSADRRAQFVPEVLRTGQVDGRQYAVPFGTNVPLLYYKAGREYPRDVGRFLRLAARDGYAGQWDDYEGGTVNLLEAIHSYGAEVVEDGRVVVAEPENAEKAQVALRQWGAMMAGAIARRPDHRTLQERSSMREFRRPQIGYLRHWAYSFHELAADPAMRAADGSLRFEIGRFPARGVLGGFNLAIARNSPNAAEARELIDFLTSREAQTTLFTCGGYPAVIEQVYTDFRERPTTCGKEGGDDELALRADDLRTLAMVVRAGLDDAVTRPASPHYALFSEVFRSCVRTAVQGGRSSSIDLSALATALQEALAGRRASDTPCTGAS
ncbi:extracellular solute-binding protein [Nonomuraea sp. NPDC050404]|uniref:extracellular solute-binding protein n=1 Tax=Nonomuraea sp. NPDC050404 TaxID=3155783 RepID=UPI00340FF792